MTRSENAINDQFLNMYSQKGLENIMARMENALDNQFVHVFSNRSRKDHGKNRKCH